MLNIILAFDEEDTDIGLFNRGCKEDFIVYLKENKLFNHKDINIVFISSVDLSYSNIEKILLKYETFIFVAYSHGEIDQLVCNKEAYVKVGTNTQLFRNTFFYTVSCLTGKFLGERLIDNGCHVFLGYKEFFNLWDGYKEFSTCANYGFFKFIEGCSVDSAYEATINKYNECIDRLYKKDFFVAAFLEDNKKGLVKFGKGGFVINDIHV